MAEDQSNSQGVKIINEDLDKSMTHVRPKPETNPPKVKPTTNTQTTNDQPTNTETNNTSE